MDFLDSLKSIKKEMQANTNTSKLAKKSSKSGASVKNLEKLASHIFETGVKVLSIYAFSIENFKRDEEEVNYLMNLFAVMFKNKLKTIKNKNIKIVFSKKEFGLPSNLERLIKEIEEETKNNTSGILNICINYSFEQEMIDTIKKINKLLIDNVITIEDIDANLISKNLYQDLSSIVLIIRTSCEYRLNNFNL